MRRHWPPTSGIFATFFTGPEPHETGPAIVETLVATMEASIASVSLMSSARLTTSSATSKIEWP